jgi:hypothetical protein
MLAFLGGSCTAEVQRLSRRTVSTRIGSTVLLAGMIAPEAARIIARHRWPMDEKQNTDLARSLDQIISLLRGILIALWAIVGLPWFIH